jgi:hypothetical protein
LNLTRFRTFTTLPTARPSAFSANTPNPMSCSCTIPAIRHGDALTRQQQVMSGFHRFCATKPVSSETSKAERRSNLATIVLSGTRGPSLFLVIREGLESRGRLGARSTQRLTNQLRLALEPECLENSTATAREIPKGGAEALRDTQANRSQARVGFRPPNETWTRRNSSRMRCGRWKIWSAIS